MEGTRLISAWCSWRRLDFVHADCCFVPIHWIKARGDI